MTTPKTKGKMKPQIYRQGDVLLERVNSAPPIGEKQKHGGKIILALGEATGHHHAIDLDEPDSADWWKHADGTQTVTLKKPATVTHQEHDPLPLAPGSYRVTRQREYHREIGRNVAD